MASIAGKGHDSWSKRPGPWMALQSAASEAVLAPGALVCLAASGLVDESLAASEAALQVAVACWLGLSLVTSLVRSYTPVPLRLLNHVAWVVIPTVAAAAAWGRPAVLPIGIYIFARTAFVMLGSMFRSSPTLEMLESARKVGGAMPPAGVPVLPRARILLASDAVPPKLDGVAVFSKHACRELTAKGHTVHVLTSVPGEERIEGCEVTRLFGIRPQYYPEHSLTVPMPWDLPIVFARVRPHCVHLMDASMFLSGSLSFFCWLFEIPCVMSHHTRIDMYATYILPGIGSLVPNTLMYLYRRLTTGFAPTNLAVCTSLANQMVDHFGCRPHRVAIWHSGTDTRSFNPKLRSDETRLEILSAPDVDQEEAEAAAKAAGKAAPRRPAPADLPIVLYVGRIAPEKDVDIIADMARLVNPPDRPPRCRIAVVGKGPTMPALRESLRGTGVALLGPRYNKDLQLHYAAADVFLTTCTTEAFCLVGLEAMASGLPVVGPDSGGVMELFDEGVEGLFYKPRSAADAARAVVEAIEKHGAAKTDCPMRLAARAKVEAQSWELTYRQAAFWYRDQILAY
ncbi:hypothetical protein FNF29_07253 [Cafeteria roenbergensis]|uniref:Glycosyltransferase subfamily 4-like N-terminal domain-containing protein n=1 Tax=Cafeteria roenbergensis TaxID=33653 RepID=A0A5A8C3H8_CAFRO|nr:hypothetical protein FNF29_07253 [Cafeteria roenbergensis]KAA0167096.1 hypothetical protein FNF31_00982 [Cafeteria roenbergensis]|eukprot:KAA0147606.1 hypothetical protein FNF29_07253 [Cafeteria roenbergensis]